MLLLNQLSVLMGSSYQTQGGKSGVNPALSRNCEESFLFSESGCPPIVVDVHQLSARYRLCLKAFFGFDWEVGCQALAKSRVWRYCLIALGSATSLIYSHAPLVSFATLAGITLNRRQAIVSVALIWFVNQFYGFTIRHYPLSAIAFLWCMTMGLGAIVVTLIASMLPKFSDRSWARQSVWLGIALLLGSAVYQSGTLLVNQWVGIHGLIADVLLRIFVRDGIWAIALFTLYTVLLLNHQRILRRTLR